MRKQLLDRATAIHAVKVAKTLDDKKVESSFNQIGIFRAEIQDTETSEAFEQLLLRINNWANTYPIVTEGEIRELRPNAR